MAMSQSAHRETAAAEVVACVQQIREARASASIRDDDEEKNEVQAEYERNLAKNRNLRVAIVARGPLHEDEEYSAGEFTNNEDDLAYQRKMMYKNIKKNYRRRLKWATKDQRRHGGPIKLWTFAENKKKGNGTMKNATENKAMKKEEKREKEELKNEKKPAKEKAMKKSTKKSTKKAGKKDKKTKTKKSRGSSLAEGKIKLLTKENPKRHGSKAWKRFELYKKHHTVSSYLEAGGKQSSLRYDEKHDHIKITDKKTKAELKAKEK